MSPAERRTLDLRIAALETELVDPFVSLGAAAVNCVREDLSFWRGVRAALAAPAPSHSEAVASQARDESGRMKGTSADCEVVKGQSAVSDKITNGSADPRPERGTSADYLTARIARDAPEVALGKKAVQLATVAPAQRPPGVASEDKGHGVPLVDEGKVKQEKRLRAIAERAPHVVKDVATSWQGLRGVAREGGA